MAAATILAVEQGWAGDRKRHLVGLTLGTTNADTISPNAIGLQKIEAITPTGAVGTLKIAGKTVTTTDHGTGPKFAFGTSTCTITVQTATNVAFYVYGW